ncbi:MAG: hypothetical protein ACRES7_09470 [Gammaproteobacteria bacterium]
MAILDDLRQAVTGALSESASAARAQGTALKGDFEAFVKPQLDDMLVKVEFITSNYVAGNIGKEQAQENLTIQRNRIQPIILAVAELALQAVQVIINAVADAVKNTVNTAAGIALL